jgi:nickel superoxide dismutase
MIKLFLQLTLSVLIFFTFCVKASAHCEMPCGIYDDKMRINMIDEHIVTIEKSMNKILKLGKIGQRNPNQFVRWIMNKERHADEIQDIVTQYFMTQRIKTGMNNYTKTLGLLHQILVYSMKCKQTTDLTHIKTLKQLVKDFEGLYFK